MSNLYSYGDHADLTPQELFFCVMVEETCNHFAVSDVVEVAMILAGQNWLPTRAKPAGAIARTSIASRISRAVLDIKVATKLPTLVGPIWKLRYRTTTHLGAFVGRWTPWAGVALMAFDVFKISVTTLAHYNRLVKPEDQIDDATAGSFG
ncbi:STM2901 family protein [Paraburkholderia caribensis]|uniref:STM2901 family protein n=1 Tax=Paraburkholderia caribensis TaxID=75105 RepID=UPI00055C9448|nr:hypothetical protein [Paraburkholderia caribensis]